MRTAQSAERPAHSLQCISVNTDTPQSMYGAHCAPTSNVLTHTYLIYIKHYHIEWTINGKHKVVGLTGRIRYGITKIRSMSIFFQKKLLNLPRPFLPCRGSQLCVKCRL